MWQSLVRNWVMQNLRGRLSQQARQAATGAAPASAEAASPEDVPVRPAVCHVGVVVAEPAEASELVDRLTGTVKSQGEGFTAHEGELAGRQVVIVTTGPGADAARQGVMALAAGHRPRWIVAAGFATALAPELRIGDIVMADRLLGQAGSSSAAADGELSVDFQIDPAALAALRHLHVGRLLTADRLPTDGEQKRLLAERYQALAADRQSAVVAEVCRHERVRFLAVRVVREACESLPVEVDNLVRQRTWPGRIGAVAAAVLHRPSSVSQLWGREEDALVAGQRLGQFLAGIIEQLN
jgi:adenosylhomocysteine nucleosidase